jgi:co-chaperonin GroES (HSP10)
MKYTSWEARPGFLILLPSRTAPTKQGIILPESATKKSSSGICIDAGSKPDLEIFLKKECFFAQHSEYQIQDSDSGWLLYIVEANHIIMMRTPPPEVETFSRRKEPDSFQPEAIERSLQ